MSMRVAEMMIGCESDAGVAVGSSAWQITLTKKDVANAPRSVMRNDSGWRTRLAKTVFGRVRDRETRSVRAGLAVARETRAPPEKILHRAARECGLFEISNIPTAFRAIPTKKGEPCCFTSNPPVSRDEAKRFAAALILLFAKKFFRSEPAEGRRSQTAATDAAE